MFWCFYIHLVEYSLSLERLLMHHVVFSASPLFMAFLSKEFWLYFDYIFQFLYQSRGKHCDKPGYIFWQKNPIQSPTTLFKCLMSSPKNLNFGMCSIYFGRFPVYTFLWRMKTIKPMLKKWHFEDYDLRWIWNMLLLWLDRIF